MTSQRRVALIYGDSVFLTSIAGALCSLPELEVMLVKPRTESLLTELHPDFVLVDAAQTTPNQMEELMALFPANHSPPFISLSADAMQLTVLSAQHFPAVDLSDLTQALEKITRISK